MKNIFMANKSSNSTPGGETRRDFIKKTASAAAVVASTGLLRTPVYGQNTAPSANVTGANSKLTLGFIGLGNQGLNSHLNPVSEKSSENNTATVAVCDVSKTRVANALKALDERGVKDAKGYEDYKELLARKDIDAIFCATVDHWHGRVSIDAMNAGKHVYVEKPMTRYLGEAFEVYDTVKKTGKVFQVGSQGCSDMKWHQAAEWVKGGKIGPVVMSQGSYMRNTVKGEWNYTIQDWAKANDINWNAWLGPDVKARKKEFSADDYFRWRKYYPYCGGLLSDLFPHKVHPYMLATGNPEFPLRVAAVGSKKIHTDKNSPGTPERDVPEIVQLIAEFPSGMVMHITTSSVNEQGTQEMIRGHKASLYMAGNKVELKPEKPYSEDIDPEVSQQFPVESIPAHQKNFFDSIRASKLPNCNIELAIRVQTVLSLGEMSERLNMMCLFDEKTRTIKSGDGSVVKPITYGTLELS